MDKHKLAAVYAQLALGYQNALVMKVLEKYKSLEAFSRAVYQKQVDPALLRPKQMEKAMQAKLEDARKIVDDCARLGIMVSAIGDEHYPKPFLQLCDPPAVVYIKGTLPDFDTTLGITVVGSRKVEQRACDNAFWLGKSLARAGACVISGLAQGIDASAQGGALDAEGKTVAVLGNGIDVCYPRENTVVQQKIARFGCLVSEYPPSTPPLAYHFPQRNRLMAALGRAVAVVEAREKSGAMITVNLALELGRDVFCMPGDIGRDSCKGNLALLREGAYVFTSAADILNEYRSEFKDTIQIERADVPYGEGVAAMWMFISNKMAEQESKTSAPQRCASPALTPDAAYSPVPEAGHAANAGAPLASAPQTPPAVQTLPEECSASAVQVYRVLDSTPRQFDEIVNNTSLPASIVLRALTELQIGGYIKTYAGRRFSL